MNKEKEEKIKEKLRSLSKEDVIELYFQKCYDYEVLQGDLEKESKQFKQQIKELEEELKNQIVELELQLKESEIFKKYYKACLDDSHDLYRKEIQGWIKKVKELEEELKKYKSYKIDGERINKKKDSEINEVEK